MKRSTPLNAVPAYMACMLGAWLASGVWAATAAAAPAGAPAAARVGGPASVAGFSAGSERHALLVGNADYPGEARDLINPVSDVKLLARTLSELGFRTTVLQNAGRTELQQAVQRFADSLPADATAFVYFAGHGVQIGGANYLIPSDVALRSEPATRVEAYPLASLLRRLAESRSAVNIVVLDACRNNPFQPEPGSRMRKWNLDGLSKAVVPRGTLVAYSTAPGEVAADGLPGNSVFAQALARELGKPGQPLELGFRKAGAWVRQQTRDEQIPWTESSLTADFYLRPPEGASLQLASRQRLSPGGGQNVAQARRGGAPEPSWYGQMTPQQWAELEWSIAQRVRRLTPDELPGIERKARAGSVVAMTTLGLVYREGISRSVNDRTGVTRSQGNNTLAVRWLTRAADSGFAIAQTELGEMYFQGHGVDRSPARSRALLQSAAASGYPRAQLDLAHLDLMENPTAESASELGKAVGRLLQSQPPLGGAVDRPR